MKTAIEKMKETAIAAAIVSVILAIFSLITAIAHIVSAAGASAAADTASYLGMMGDTVMMCALLAVAAVMFAGIAKSGTPFSVSSVKLLRVIAVILMLSAAVGPCAEAIALMVMGETVTAFSLNSGVLFLGVILLLLVQIFSYGTLLQQESDETL